MLASHDEQVIVASIVLFTALHGFVLALLLFVVKSKHPLSNRLLGLLLFFYSFNFVDGAFSMLPHYLLQHPHWFAATYWLRFLHGPLLLFYVYSFIRKDFALTLKHRLHYLPAIICLLIYIPIFMLSEADKTRLIEHVFLAVNIDAEHLQIHLDIIFASIILSAIQPPIYFYLIISALRKHQKSLIDVFSSLEKANLNWLYYLAWSQFIAYMLGYIVYAYSMSANANQDIVHVIQYIPGIILALSVYAIGYMGLKQPALFIKQDDIAQRAFEPLPKRKHHGNRKTSGDSYSTTSFTAQEAEHYKEKLLRLMDEEKPYLNSELTLHDLADMIDIRQSLHLTQLLNQTLEKNFFEFINDYRMATAKQLLKNEPSSRAIIDIAYESGFNSKSSFYHIFKKYTGITPTAYREGNPS